MSETETTDQVETTDESADAPAQPDLSEQFTNLSQKLDNFLEANQAPESPQPSPTDLFLGGEDDDETEDDFYVPDQPAADPRVDAMLDYLTKQEQDKLEAEVKGLASKYQDFTEKVPEIRDVLDEYGIDNPVQRAKLSERIYLSLKAAADADAETPAEEARSRGARLETDASAGAPSEEDPDAQFIANFGKNRGDSVFG